MSNMHPLMAVALAAMQRGDESAAAEALEALPLEVVRRASGLAHEFGPACAPVVIAAFEFMGGILRAGCDADETEAADVLLRKMRDAKTEDDE